jgi:hypothetical protein
MPKRLLIGAVVLVVSGGCSTSSRTVDPAHPPCRPATATSLTTAAAVQVFDRLALAVKSGDQRCADSLSSSYFRKVAIVEFPGSSSTWVTFHHKFSTLVAPSMQDRFATLSIPLHTTRFTQDPYARSTDLAPDQPQTATDPNQVRGITLSYPIPKWTAKVSFVLEHGQILMDEFLLYPL